MNGGREMGGLDWETAFSVSGMAAMIGWLILVLGPRRIPWLRDVPRLAIPFLFGLSYAALALPGFFGSEDGGYGSLAEVRALLATDAMLLAGWQHYLAFDLLVGAWAATRLDAARVSRLIQAPILLAIFMFGPAGFVLSVITEAAAARTGRGAERAAT
ncbi:MAG: ABA4-like family protein [Pseudomonadota bacterium]